MQDTRCEQHTMADRTVVQKQQSSEDRALLEESISKALLSWSAVDALPDTLSSASER